ncbi:MAG: TetR/AcrR family transcriptional regulator C-terminal domain-containing protein [Thermoleophilia bacterium]|jgi:AcrR family transcriptional regulator
MAVPADRPALSRPRILRAALALIDREGLDGLSIRALAGELGTRPMSLYRHVRDKADILGGVTATLLGEIAPLAPSGDWTRDLRDWAVGFRAVMRAHPRAVPLFADRPITSYVDGREMAEDGLRLLEQAGIEPVAAARIMRSVARFVVGFSVTDSASRTEPDPAVSAGLRAEGFPRLAALVDSAGPEDGDELFLLNLGALIDGLALRWPGDGCTVPGRDGPAAATAAGRGTPSEEVESS